MSRSCGVAPDRSDDLLDGDQFQAGRDGLLPDGDRLLAEFVGLHRIVEGDHVLPPASVVGAAVEAADRMQEPMRYGQLLRAR